MFGGKTAFTQRISLALNIALASSFTGCSVHPVLIFRRQLYCYASTKPALISCRHAWLHFYHVAIYTTSWIRASSEAGT